MSKIVQLSSIKDLDYEKLGLKSGLEIHQQLNCGKLFCSCPCVIVSNDTLNKEISRKLRFSHSETGEIDKAAIEEFKKGKYNIYKYNDEIACLVDLDEQPPGIPNQKAINTGIRISQMLNLNIFDKIQFMRKIIIDGSVTGGFQRTALLGINGNMKTSFGNVEIEGVNVEEDSCRVISREDDKTIFSLDRQGIPLIEITTGPQMKTPMQVKEAATQIGTILRSFEETRRGLGTIRQDLNISIKGGARVEIKGAQNLKLIDKVVENEVKRQYVLLSIIDELKTRKINNENFSDFKIYDVSEVFQKTTSKVMLENLKIKNSKVLGIKLNNFRDVLGTEIQENFRFATEVSNRNKKHFPQIKGLFHSDELPNYGITENEVSKVRNEMKLSRDDSFIILCQEENLVRKSLENILEIIKELISDVPVEVRQVDPKGTITNFLRPMPGSARMYPETDLYDIEITKEYLKDMKSKLPELYDEKISRVKNKWDLEESKVEEVLSKFNESDIENLIKISNKKANYIYSILFEIPKDIKKRESLEPVDFRYELLESIVKKVSSDELNQNTLRDLFISLYKDELDNIENLSKYLEDNNLIGEQIDEGEIEKKIKEIVEKNEGAPFGALMGICMKAFNGNVDGKKISEILKKLN